MKAFCSWSGGKDSAYSLYLSQTMGIKCVYLLTMLDETGLRLRSHGVPKELVLAQSRALDIPILTVSTSWESYEKNFREALFFFRDLGIECGIFGDVYLDEHRLWVERVTQEGGFKSLLPLWRKEEKEIITEFFNAGFRAIICAVRVEELLDHLGEDLSLNFLSKLKGLGLDPLGENGEYHTFVYDGPNFREKVEFEILGIRRVKDFYFLNFGL